MNYHFIELKQVQRPSVLYTYVVTGCGHFPIDMLRTEQAWPANRRAVSRIQTLAGGHRRIRSIRLCSFKQPDTGYWAAMGWVCRPEDEW